MRAGLCAAGRRDALNPRPGSSWDRPTFGMLLYAGFFLPFVPRPAAAAAALFGFACALSFVGGAALSSLLPPCAGLLNGM